MENSKELLKRIAYLSNLNKKLREVIRDGNKEYDLLLDENLKLLKEQKGAAAKADKSIRLKTVTVLYIEVVGFKNVAQEEEVADDLYDELDLLFISFKEISDKHKIERLKTLGDHYMCAGGVAEKNTTNPVDVVLAALEMRQHVNIITQRYASEGKPFWKIKMGVHTGNGTATIKGRKKVTYEMTGEVVNFISRIASYSELGEITISDYTYELVKSYFSCEYRGKLPIKYRGNLDLYELKRVKKKFSINSRLGAFPNNDFMIRYKLRQFNDLQERMLNFLQSNLPDHLTYHNYKHTIDVVNQAELIGYGEGVDDHQILLLKTAALFHDSGHTIDSAGHEAHGCGIAREWLPKYNYSQPEIDEICTIIMATEMPPSPVTLLEKIICDSDLDYLGRADFIPISEALYEEFKFIGIVDDYDSWNELQVKFLSAHQFLTATSQRLREVSKQRQVARIRKLLLKK